MIEAGFRKKPVRKKDEAKLVRSRTSCSPNLEAIAGPPYEVLGPAQPGQRCAACAQLGDVMRISYKGNIHCWHEDCAARLIGTRLENRPEATSP